MANIETVEGIGTVYAEKLKTAGINTVEGLLTKGAAREGRKSIANATGIDEGKILDWVNMADLTRVKGVGGEFSELLKAAGVDTVKELRNRNPESLHAKLVEINNQKRLTRLVPGMEQITDFIEQAKKLNPMVSYN